VNVLNNIAFYYLQISDFENVLKFTKQSIELSKKNQYNKGEIDAVLIQGAVYHYKGDFPKAETIYNEAFKLSTQYNNTNGIIRSKNNLGSVFLLQGENNKAKENYIFVLQESKKHNDTLNIAKATTNIGLVYFQTGYYNLAADYFYKALPYSEKAKNNESLAALLLHIGLVEHRLKNDTSALEYSQKSLSLFKNDENKRGMSMCYDLIANCQFTLNDIEISLEFRNKSMEINKQIGDYYGLITDYNALSLIYKHQNKLVESLDLLNIADSLIKQTKLYSFYAELLINKSAIYKQLNQLDKAEELSLQALKFAQEKGNIHNQYQAYQELAIISEQKSNFKFAYEYRNKQLNLGDSIFSIEKNKQTAELKEKYETEKKEQQIKLQEVELAKQQITIQNQWFAIAISALLFVVVSLLFFIFRQSSKSKQAQLILETERSKIEIEKNVRQRIGQDLHDLVAPQVASIKHKTQLAFTENNLILYQDIVNQLDTTYNEVRTISYGMNPPLLKEFGLTDAIQNICENIEMIKPLNFNVQEIGFDSRLDETKEIQIFFALHEIINNITKYSQANEIFIELVKSDSKNLCVAVEYNGIGFDYNTAKQKGGQGLSNIETRINQFLGGQIEYDTQPNRERTFISMNIPL